MKKAFLAIVILLSTVAGFAQQDAQFTHYPFNQLYLNPAFAGMNGAFEGYGPEFRLIHRTQWLGYDPTLIDVGGHPITEIFTTDVYSRLAQGGAGFSILTDKVGKRRYTTINLALSKHITLGSDDRRLGIGLQGSYAANRYEPGWRPPQEGTQFGDDLAIPYQTDGNGNLIPYTEGFMDASAGLWYQDKNLSLGVSMNRLLDNQFEFNQVAEGGYRKHLYFMGSYNITSVLDWEFIPSLLVKSTMSGGGTQFELGGMARYNKEFWGGLNFRQGESFGLLIGKGFLAKQKLKIGYAVDFTVAGRDAKTGTSHEIMLSYFLPSAINNLPPAIRTPRFQF